MTPLSNEHRCARESCGLLVALVEMALGVLMLLQPAAGMKPLASFVCNGVLYVERYSASVVPTATTWHEMSLHCQGLGGWLPTINSSPTDAEVLALAVALGTSNVFTRLNGCLPTILEC